LARVDAEGDIDVVTERLETALAQARASH
jgi:hypothetical protein